MIPDWLGCQTKKHQTQTKLIYVNGKKHGTASPTGFQRCTQTPNNSVPTDTTTTGNANQNPDQQTTQSNVQLESHKPSTNITLSPPKQLTTQNTQWLSLVLWNAHSIVNKPLHTILHIQQINRCNLHNWNVATWFNIKLRNFLTQLHNLSKRQGI